MCTNRLLLVAINVDNTNLNGNVGVSHNLFNAAKTTAVRLNSDYDRVGTSMKENNPQILKLGYSEYITKNRSGVREPPA